MVIADVGIIEIMPLPLSGIFGMTHHSLVGVAVFGQVFVTDSTDLIC